MDGWRRDFHTPVAGGEVGSCKAMLVSPSNRYEEEINKRTTAENDFMLLKKVRPTTKKGHTF